MAQPRIVKNPIAQAITRTLSYVAEPTAIAFHKSKDEVRGLMGPVGIGKTTAMCQELQMQMEAQPPNADAIRNTKWVVVRQTNKDLLTTVIESWEKWFPSAICRITKTTSPITAYIDMPLSDGTRSVSKVYFIPLDRPEDVETLGSLEVTGGWLSEAADHETNKIFLKVWERSGRYPMGAEGNCDGKKIIMEYNPPQHGSWLYNLFEVTKPAGASLFRFPPVLLPVESPTEDDPEAVTWVRNPEAEGVQHNPAGFKYWEDLVRMNPDDFPYLNRMVAGEYSPKVSGTPVFKLFKHSAHVSKVSLKPVPGIPIVSGIDWGFYPGFISTQLIRGKIYVYRCLQPDNVTFGELFDDYVLPMLRTDFGGYTHLISCDPAGLNRNNIDGRDRINAVRRDYKLRIVPSYTNDIETRIDNVNHFLRRRDGIIIDPSCIFLIEALAGGYHREKDKNTQLLKPKPVKNRASDVADALQYVASYYRKGAMTEGATLGVGARAPAKTVQPAGFLFV